MRDTSKDFRSARRQWLATALAGLTLSWPIAEAAAQNFVDRPPIYGREPTIVPNPGIRRAVEPGPVLRPGPGLRQAPGGRTPRGGGGLGAAGAIGIGIGLGVLGAIATQNAARGEEPPPRLVREPRRIRVIDDEDAPPIRVEPRDGGKPPPKNRPPRAADRTPGPTIRIPPANETRFAPGEVLIETRGSARLDPIAARLGLEILSSRAIRLTGTTLHRLRARDGRSTQEILTRLRAERAIAFAQPNWVYTLQQDATAPADAAPAVPTTPAADAAPPSIEASNPTPAETAAPPLTAAAATTTPPPAQPLPGQYAADKLRLPAVHDRVTGRDVLVAVIDTGADATHPELTGAIEASFDALDGVDPTPGAHGTAMAGAIAARLRLSGTAPAARLLAARAFGPPAANGVAEGSTYHVVACLDWAVERGARVVSMSFAGPSNTLLARALAAAEAKGVIAVAAAGNAGPQSPPLFPAADANVIAVTASDADDRVLPAANRGAHLLLTAPGVDILVAAPKGGYDLTSGTSVAAAEVSGIVALLVEKRGRLTPAEARRILAETAIDLGAKGRDPIFGAGLVDAEAAVSAATRTR